MHQDDPAAMQCICWSRMTVMHAITNPLITYISQRLATGSVVDCRFKHRFPLPLLHMLHHGPIVGCRSGAANVASVFRVVVTLSLVMVGCLTGHSAESLDSNRNKKVFDGNLGSVSSSGGAPSQFLDGSQILRRERHWVRSASSPNRGADIPDFKRLRIHPVPLPQRIQGFRTTNRVHGPP